MWDIQLNSEMVILLKMSSYIINFTNTSSEEGTVIADVGFLYSDKLNSVNDGNFIFSGSSELKRSLIEVGSQVKVYKNGILDFHGLVDDVQFYDGGAMNVHASGYEVWLAKENGAYAGSPWTATASATIFSAVIAESNYFTAGTVEAGTSIDFRANVSDSLLNVINNLRKKTAQDYQIDYINTEIDILDHRGSTTSVETINAGIQIGDVQITHSYPIANKIKVYGQSEGQTRIESDVAQGQDATSQSTYGVISYTIEDRTITTVAEANLLANAEVARLKDKRKIYAFDVLNPNKTWIAGDVLTLNAPSQGVSAEEVRIVQIKRGIKDKKEILEIEVTNKEYSELTKSRDEIIAELQKKSRDAASYDTFQDEYSNQVNTTTSIGGVIDIYPPNAFDLNGYGLFDTTFVVNDTGNLLISADGVLELAGASGITIDNEVDMSSKKITSLATCTADGDAANKGYVDGKVAIVKGTHYWSCPGSEFITFYPDVDDVSINEELYGNLNLNAITGASVSVHLPHGAVITGAVVYGNDTAETWELIRKTTSTISTTASLASAAINTEDTTISTATVDNANYAYYFVTSQLDSSDYIYGARITYTL